jgi:hypothetical protein
LSFIYECTYAYAYDTDACDALGTFLLELLLMGLWKHKAEIPFPF